MAKESELTQAYLNRAAESLASAQLLLDSSFYDDAVSRAYYAIFYAAKVALVAIGIEGLRHTNKPIFSVQYHSEASPGPHDALGFFSQFVEMMNSKREAT